MRRQLAQLRPSGTSAVSFFSTSTHDGLYTMDLINICNVSSAIVYVSIFHDVDGSIYDEDTSLVWEYPIGIGQVFLYEPYKGVSDNLIAGNIGIQVSVASAANFTGYGEVEGENL